MRDNLSIVIAMLVFVILVVIFPLYNYFERQDDMSYNLALKATTNFVDEVLETGYLTQEMYDNYINLLGDTGNIYDIQLEAHRKLLIEEINKDGSGTGQYNEQYLINYNSDIFKLDAANTGDITNINDRILKDGAYYFNQGDQFYVKMKNSNTTMAGAIFNTIVPTASKDRIVVNYGGIIKNQSWEKVDAKFYGIHPTVITDLATIVYRRNASSQEITVSGMGETITLTTGESKDFKITSAYITKNRYIDGLKCTITKDGDLKKEYSPGNESGEKLIVNNVEEYNFDEVGTYIIKAWGTKEGSDVENSYSELKVIVTEPVVADGPDASGSIIPNRNSMVLYFFVPFDEAHENYKNGVSMFLMLPGQKNLMSVSVYFVKSSDVESVSVGEGNMTLSFRDKNSGEKFTKGSSPLSNLYSPYFDLAGKASTSNMRWIESDWCMTEDHEETFNGKRMCDGGEDFPATAIAISVNNKFSGAGYWDNCMGIVIRYAFPTEAYGINQRFYFKVIEDGTYENGEKYRS